MRIGIFGGAFNPIHKGHLQIAQNLLDQKIVDEVWLLPCFSHVWNKELAPAEDRVKMINLALNFNNFEIKNCLKIKNLKLKIKLCGIELKQKRPVFTIDTVKILKKRFPQHNFYWIIGSDNFKTLNKWHSYEKLLNLIPFIIVPRTKDNYSSTIIRERVQKGLPITNLAPPFVERYIIDRKLYGSS